MENQNEKAYEAIRKFVASGFFLLVFIYLAVSTQNRLALILIGMLFLLCLLLGLKAALIKVPSHDAEHKKVVFSKGKKIDY